MRKLLASFAALALIATPAFAQLGPSNNLPIGPQAGSGGGGGGGGPGTFTTTCPSSSQTGSTITFTNGASPAAHSSSYAVLAADCGKTIEATGSSTTITMPSTIVTGMQVTVGNANASGGANITLAPGGSNTFNGSSSSITLVPGQFVGVFSGSGVSPTNWDVAGANQGAGPTGPGYSVGSDYLPAGVGTLSGSGGGSITLTYCAPVWLNNASPGGGGTFTVSTVGEKVVTAGTTNLQIALYANDTTVAPFRPGALLSNTASISDNVTAGTVVTGALGSSVSGLGQNMIWGCVQVDDTTVRFASTPGTATNLVADGMVGTASFATLYGNGNQSGGVTTTGTFGTWPSTLHGSTWSLAGANTPVISFSVASIP